MGDKNLKPCNRRKEIQKVVTMKKSLKRKKKKVLPMVLVEKALGLGFMVELNL